MIKCKSADRYQGLVPPRCNRGRPCKACRDKYNTLQFDQAKTRRMLAAIPGVTVKHVAHGTRDPKVGAVKSYYGGEISAKEKADHERRITGIYLDACQHHNADEMEAVLKAYRRFVKACSTARPPYVTGTEKGDRRLIAQAGVSGEAGEVSNVIKKIMFRDHAGEGPITPERREALQTELGDLFWYFMSTCIVFDFDLFDDVIMMNMRKLVKRGR